MKDKVVVFGSIVQDLISYTTRFPRPGESIRGDGFQLGAGGKGANQSVAAARVLQNPERVVMIGMVGDDTFGESNISSLTANGVDARFISKSATNHTATATITVANGENSIVVTLGANSEMSEKKADECKDVISEARIILCQGEIPETANKRAFEIAKANGVTTFLNPAPGDPNMDKSILKLTDIICVNENETEFLTGIDPNTTENAQLAAKKITEMGVEQVIITLGAKGCLLYCKSGEPKFIEAIKIDNVIDTTGAGDCFCGTLAALISSGIDVESAVESACRIAALSVTRKGTQSSYFRMDEIRKNYAHCLPAQI